VSFATKGKGGEWVTNDPNRDKAVTEAERFLRENRYCRVEIIRNDNHYDVVKSERLRIE
jgi:hypothetical protein